MLPALTSQAVTRAALDDPVVWALLVIIAVLTSALGLFIRSVLRERDYWRQAFFEMLRQNQEVAMPTAKIVQGVMRRLPHPEPPGSDEST